MPVLLFAEVSERTLALGLAVFVHQAGSAVRVNHDTAIGPNFSLNSLTSSVS